MTAHTIGHRSRRRIGAAFALAMLIPVAGSLGDGDTLLLLACSADQERPKILPAPRNPEQRTVSVTTENSPEVRAVTVDHDGPTKGLDREPSHGPGRRAAGRVVRLFTVGTIAEPLSAHVST